MAEPWMLLNIWGEPIDASALKGMELRTSTLDEIKKLAATDQRSGRCQT
jgi:hypothetical protein